MMMAIIWHSLRRNETWTLKTQKTVWQTTAVGCDLSRHICSCSDKIDGLVYNASAAKLGRKDSSENGVWARCQMVSRVTGKSQICKKNESDKTGDTTDGGGWRNRSTQLRPTQAEASALLHIIHLTDQTSPGAATVIDRLHAANAHLACCGDFLGNIPLLRPKRLRGRLQVARDAA